MSFKETANDQTRHDGWQESRIPILDDRPIELTVSNPNGLVTVRASDRDDALIRFVRRGRRPARDDDSSAVKIVAERNRIDVRIDPSRLGKEWDGDLSIDVSPGSLASATAKSGSIFAEVSRALVDVGHVLVHAGNDLHFDIEIELPRRTDTRMTVATASGDIDVSGITGAVAVTSASGDARVADGRGDIHLRTTSGDLQVDRIQGRFVAQSTSGDLRLTGAQLDQFTVQAVSGDVLMESTLVRPADSQVKTVSGDVSLRIATDEMTLPGLSLFYKTVSGDAMIDPAFRQVDRRTWQVGNDGAGGRLSVQTVSGDLQVRLGVSPAASSPAAPTPVTVPAPPAAPVAPMPPHPKPAAAKPPGAAVETPSDDAEAAPSEDEAARLAVLEAVERGEIDIDEALRRLDPDSEPERDPPMTP